MKNTILLFAAILLISIGVYAQKYSKVSKNPAWDYQYKNVGKISSIALALKNVSLTYERSIKLRLTGLLAVGYKFSGGWTPSLFKDQSASILLGIKGIKGFSITPEVRYYLRSCENQTPNGFYTSIYLRYMNFNSGLDFTYYPNYPNKEDVYYFNADARFNEYGVGFLIGYQLLIKKRFVIDFMMIGPRYSWISMKYDFDESISEKFLTDLEGYLQSIVDRFEIDHKVEIDKSGIKDASVSFNFTNVRFGISLGYSF